VYVSGSKAPVNCYQLQLEIHNEENFNPQGATTEDHRRRFVSNLDVLVALRAP
jgi:hypothetical protein